MRAGVLLKTRRPDPRSLLVPNEHTLVVFMLTLWHIHRLERSLSADVKFPYLLVLFFARTHAGTTMRSLVVLPIVRARSLLWATKTFSRYPVCINFFALIAAAIRSWSKCVCVGKIKKFPSCPRALLWWSVALPAYLWGGGLCLLMASNSSPGHVSVFSCFL